MHKLVIMDKLFIQGNQQYVLQGQKKKKNIYIYIYILFSLFFISLGIKCQTFIDFSSWKWS